MHNRVQEGGDRPIGCGTVGERRGRAVPRRRSAPGRSRVQLGSVKIRRLAPWIWSNIEVELPETLPLIPQLFIVWHLLRRHLGE